MTIKNGQSRDTCNSWAQTQNEEKSTQKNKKMSNMDPQETGENPEAREVYV